MLDQAVWLRVLCLATWLCQCAAVAAPLAPVAPGLKHFAPRFESVGAGAIPRDVVPTFIQDQQGYLWIATGDGLVRFDGYRFRPQERQSQEPIARNLGWIRAMLAGSDGRVWIGTETKGLAAYDPATDRVTDYGALALSQSGSPASASIEPLPTIHALAQGEDGRIYVGSMGGGLELFDPKSTQFTRFVHTAEPGALPDNHIQALLMDSQQNLWVGSWAGLARKSKASQQFEVFKDAGLKGHVVQAIFEASDGRIWVGTQDGLLRILDPKTGVVTQPTVRQAGITQGPITSFVETPDHSLWVGRSGGIQIFDVPSATLLRQLQHDVRRPSGLAGNDVTHMLIDRAGWVWVSGFGLGLQRHNPGNKSIILREADLSSTSPFNTADVRSLLPVSNGEVWAATHAGGVVILDSALQALGKLPLLDVPIASMVQMTDGAIWLGSNARLQQYSPQHRRLRSISYHGGQTRRLFEGHNGTLWVGTQDGVYVLEPSSQTLVRVQDADGNPKGEVHAFAQAPDHSLWIGSSSGLYRVPAGSHAIRRVQQLDDEDVSKGIVIGLLFDSDGRLWVDTGTSGLHRIEKWDAAGASVDRISERHARMGKPFGANLLEDNLGRIWSQMNVYDPAQDKFVELTHADGANLGTGWFFSYAKMHDGRFLFGGSKGILVVKPELFEESSYAPPLLVSELRINNERRPLGNLASGITLSDTDRSFSVEFTALDYADPGRLEYAYMLENFDPQWIKTSSSSRIASYSNLAPGNYKLRIRATNRSGVWNPLEQTLAVQVAPAWWQSRWMAALAVILFALLAFALVSLHTRQLRWRQKELEERVQERTLELETMALELQLKQMALEESNVCDPLTGLNNRRFLTQCIDADISLAVRAHDNHLNLGTAFNDTQDVLFFLFDIDHFKAVNDSHGHMAGDEVLKQFSSRLKAVFRDTDYLIRWGGEEFLGVARQTSRKNAAELAERARAAIAREPFVLEDGSRIALTCSVGFACFPLAQTQPRLLGWVDMVKIADAAMYTVKHFGRNGWVGVMECQAASPSEIQEWIKRPLQEWIASGLLQHHASDRVQAALAADA